MLESLQDNLNVWLAVVGCLIAYLMDTRAVAIKKRNHIDCKGDASTIRLPDGRTMGIGVTSIEVSSIVNDCDRIHIEGFLLDKDGAVLHEGMR